MIFFSNLHDGNSTIILLKHDASMMANLEDTFYIDESASYKLFLRNLASQLFFQNSTSLKQFQLKKNFIPFIDRIERVGKSLKIVTSSSKLKIKLEAKLQ